MKLYTEEQVKEMIEKSRYTGLTAEFLIIATPPIELPSDEEIDEWIVKNDYQFSHVDIQTTKWVIEQIKQHAHPNLHR